MRSLTPFNALCGWPVLVEVALLWPPDSSASLLITQSAPISAAMRAIRVTKRPGRGCVSVLGAGSAALAFILLQDLQAAVHRAVIGGDDPVHSLTRWNLACCREYRLHPGRAV